MECCYLQSWQRSFKPSTIDQRIRISRETVVDPSKRRDIIMKTIRNRHFENDSYLKEVGIKINSDAMITLMARCIPPPEIIYKSNRNETTEVVERVNIGK